jgi:hypothetical protein
VGISSCLLRLPPILVGFLLRDGWNEPANPVITSLSSALGRLCSRAQVSTSLDKT